MAAAIWKGSISFGLVNIPVLLHSAESHDELDFKMLDSRDLAPIRYQRINERTGKEVEWEKIVKGIEHDEGHYVVLNDEDFNQARIESTQTIDIKEFVDAEEIDPEFYERPYYLVPAKGGEKAYALLLAALMHSKKVGIAQVVIRRKEYLAALTAKEGAIMLNTLRYAHELRKPSALPMPETMGGLVAGQKEIKMAERLIDEMSQRWRPARYHDRYRDALMKIVEAKKRSGGHAPRAHPAPRTARSSGKVIDIMELLSRSVHERHGKGSHRKKTG